MRSPGGGVLGYRGVYPGVYPEYLTIKRWQIATGSPFTDQEVEHSTSVALIGRTVREHLFGDEDPIGETIRIVGQPFIVIGVLSPKGQSASGSDQDDTVMLPYSAAQAKIRGKGVPWLDDIMCSAVSPDAVDPAIAQINSLLRQRHRIPQDQDPDFNVPRPEEIIKASVETRRTFSLLLLTIASVSLLVGGIGIMNVMLASVAERTKEIGVRLSVGATEGAVQIQFLAEAVALSVFGGVLGVVVSIAGSIVLGRALRWTMTIPPQAVALALLFSVAVGVFFGFHPARRAAQLDPIEALRRD